MVPTNNAHSVVWRILGIMGSSATVFCFTSMSGYHDVSGICHVRQPLHHCAEIIGA